MPRPRRPHVLGVDDGAFDVHADRDVTIVGVMMEAADLVENVAVTRFPVDGENATAFLVDWIGRQSFRPALHAIVLGEITIAGLGVVDVRALAADLGIPVLAVSRRDPREHRLPAALAAAGFGTRLAIVERTPPAFATAGGIFAAAAGIGRDDAAALLRASTGKADLPEPLRLAHLVARAVATGASRGRA